MEPPSFNYELQKEFFAQTQPGFHYPQGPLDRFGLIDDSSSRWQNLVDKLKGLSAKAPFNTSYRLIFLARHGEGFHNKAALKHGMVEFYNNFEGKATDGELTWGPDPTLTPFGEEQALALNRIWLKEMADGIPIPQSYYCSPLTRSAQTLVLSYKSIPHKSPIFIEDLREIINATEFDWQPETRPEWWSKIMTKATCIDGKRSSKSQLAKSFPDFRFEEGFTETDQIWSAENHETVEDHIKRTKKVFDHIFASDPATVIAISAHGGTCLSAQRLFGLPSGSHDMPPPSAVLPLVLKATRVV